jgi:hypothetical protein
VTARTISHWFIIKALLKLKLQAAIQAAILIGRHVYPPLLQKRCLVFFGAWLPRDLRSGDLRLYSVLLCFEFAIQIDATYLKGRTMSLQYVLIPAVGVYKGTTRTMENSPVIN